MPQQSDASEQDSEVFAQVTFSTFEAGWDGQSGCSIEVFDGYADLPVFVAGGSIYIQAPLGYVLETADAGISGGKRYMEVRVSEAGRSAFPFARVWRAIYGKRMA